MSLTYYRLDLTIAGQAYPIDSRTPPDPAAGTWVLDKLTLSWAVADATRSRLKPAPSVLSFALLTTDRANVPAFDIGQVVTVAVVAHDDFLGGEITLASFGGRISDLEASAHPRGLGFRFTVVDFLADLNEVYVGDEPWPSETAFDRFGRIEALAAAAGINIANDTFGPVAATFKARDIDRRTVAAAIQSHLDQLPPQQFLVYAYDPATGDLAYYYEAEAGQMDTAVLVPRHIAGRVTLRPLEVGESPHGPQRIVDASAVDLDATWRKDKASSTTRVLVSGEFSDGTTTAEAAHPAPSPITERVDVDYLESTQALALARALLPEEGFGQVRWALESYTIRVDGVPDLRSLLWMFGSNLAWGSSPGTPTGSARVLANIADPINLAGRPWYAGQLVGATLAVEAGEMTITATQRPTVQLAGASIAYPPLTPANLAASAEFGATRVMDLDPTLTPYDFRLAGQPRT